MDINFKGKTALVTGAGKGIGRDIAKALVTCGAQTWALSRTKEDLDTLKVEHPSINTIQVDLASWDFTRNAVQKIGCIDLLVNNAGICISKDFFDLDKDDFDATFNTNVKAVFNISQIIAKDMVERGNGGSIVNISSCTSTHAFVGGGVYCASKGALESLTKVMALELGPHQIRTNCVNPTITPTPLIKKLLPENDPKAQEILKQKRDRIPLGRFPQIKDVVNAVLYLLSDKADMINGTCLPVEGGSAIC